MLELRLDLPLPEKWSPRGQKCSQGSLGKYGGLAMDCSRWRFFASRFTVAGPLEIVLSHEELGIDRTVLQVLSLHAEINSKSSYRCSLSTRRKEMLLKG